MTILMPDTAAYQMLNQVATRPTGPAAVGAGEWAQTFRDLRSPPSYPGSMGARAMLSDIAGGRGGGGGMGAGSPLLPTGGPGAAYNPLGGMRGAGMGTGTGGMGGMGTGPGMGAPVSPAARIAFVAENQAANQIGSAARGGARAGRSALPGVLGRAGKIGNLSRVGAGLGLSYGGDMLGNALGKDTDQGRFAKGAGMGASIGMWGGPWGALAGAGIGGGLGVLLGGKGGKKQEPIANLATAMKTAGFDSQVSQQLMTYYNVVAQMGGNTKEAKQQAFDTVVPLFQEMLASQMGIGGGAGQGGAPGGYAPSPADYAALQAETARFIQPYQKAALVNGQLQADYMGGNVESLPPAYRGLMKAGAMSGQIASVNLANAYGAQAQLAPLAAAIQTGQTQMQSAANSLYAQGLNNALSGGGSGAADPFAAAGL